MSVTICGFVEHVYDNGTCDVVLDSGGCIELPLKCLPENIKENNKIRFVISHIPDRDKSLEREDILEACGGFVKNKKYTDY